MKKNLLLSLCSAILLILSFPNFNLSFLIWGALVPFLFLLDGKNPKAAFFWGWLTGYLFFLGTHYWLIHVTLPGMLLVNLYLGIYFGLFGLGYSYLVGTPRPDGLGTSSDLAARSSVAVRFMQHKLWVLPCLWVALELVRDRLFSGFGWACLGHSQYQNLPLIQIADITGVFGVSFVVVMVNVFLKGCLELPLKNLAIAAFGTIVVLGAVLGYGYFQLPRYISKPEMNLWVAIVQPSIPQSRKWDPSSWESIQKKILDITAEALKQKPGLIIWPETSFPGYTWQSPERYQEIKNFVAHSKVPLLFGTVTVREGGYYNSAILLSEKGEEAAQYDKMHLVPFGEFLPLRPFTNFIENFVPIGDFSRGERLTVFPTGLATEGSALARTSHSGAWLFSTLICFEDTVAPVVRRLVKNGPKFLVNITNDGWFKDTNAPFLHLQASAFQAVANRRAIIRAANTGVSGDISPSGVEHIFRDPTGKAVMAQGFMMSIIQPNDQFSFYTRLGDVFAWVCLFCAAGALIKRKYWL
jgi:apolipoprotein N-acyltransferase